MKFERVKLNENLPVDVNEKGKIIYDNISNLSKYRIKMFKLFNHCVVDNNLYLKIEDDFLYNIEITNYSYYNIIDFKKYIKEISILPLYLKNNTRYLNFKLYIDDNNIYMSLPCYTYEKKEIIKINNDLINFEFVIPFEYLKNSEIKNIINKLIMFKNILERPNYFINNGCEGIYFKISYNGIYKISISYIIDETDICYVLIDKKYRKDFYESTLYKELIDDGVNEVIFI